MERGFNNRTRNLRKLSVETKPYISMERAKLFTEAYKKYEGKVEVPVLRALAFKHFMKNRTLYIGKGELIVGEKGDAPQGAPTFPELCCHTLDDFEIMNSREKIAFKVSDKDKDFQKQEIIPYWEKRAIKEKIFKSMTEEWITCYEAGIFTEFMEQRAPGHTAGDGKIYNNGFLDFKKQIQQSLNELDYKNDLKAFEKKSELEAMEICCDAIIIYGKRYAEYARALAAKSKDKNEKEELLLIAENCDIVPAKKPQNYHQALQMYWFVHVAVTTELNIWDAFSPGRLDQHLYPFYKRDIENGILSKERSRELLECFWIKFNNQPAPPKVGVTLKESSTYTDFVNINTGGITKDGSDGVNEVSYLILDTMDELKILQPSSNVQISRKTPQKFLKRACEISRKGWGQPAFYNTEAIVQELLQMGKSIEDARGGGASGCVETGAWGKECYNLTGYLNLPKILQITLYNGFDNMSGKQIGLELGYAKDFENYEQLFQAFKKQLNYIIDIKIKGNNIIEAIYSKNMPSPFLSIIIDDCILKGMDYNSGGARYNTSYIQGVGIGTITDCLSAIKYNVFDKKKFTMEQLINAMDDNYENHEFIRGLILNKTPKYGNDDDYSDSIMKEVFESFYLEVTGRKNVKGGVYRIDMLPTTCHIYFGEVIGATANGRLKNKPVSEGISPEKGADINGPTAVIKSAAKMDHLKTGGTLLNQKFTPEVVSGEGGLSNMANLIKTYFNFEGHHIQFNVIDRKTLLNAQNNPDEYKDLIVRVAGYSDHFNNLSKVLQDEIIERTEQSF